MRQLLLAWLLLGAFWVAGRLLSGLAGWRARGAEGAALSLLVGACAWTVGLALLCDTGLGSPRSALVFAGGLAVVAAAGWRRRIRLPTGRGHRRGAPLLATALVAAVALALLPVLLTGGFASGSDAWLYSALAERANVGRLPAPEPVPDEPFSGPAALYARWGVPLAAIHAVALAQVVARTSALEAYPAASASAFALCAAGVFLAGRWVLGLRPVWAGAAALAHAVLPNPIAWGQLHGFLAQTWATPGLLLLLALLGRASRRRSARPADAIAVGLVLAFLALVYVPFVPVGLAAGAAHLAAGLWRTRAVGWLARFWAVAAASATVLSGVAPLRLARALDVLLHARVGGPVAAGPGELVEFALGARAFGLDAGPRLQGTVDAAAALLALGGLALLAGGLVVRWRAPGAPMRAALLVFLAGLVVQAALRQDPWTGARGHSWGVFKLLQWQYPLVLLQQVLGAQALWRRWGLRPSVARTGGTLSLSLLAVVALAFVHIAWAARVGRSQVVLMQEMRPLEAIPRIRRAFANLPAGRLLLVGRPSNRHSFLGAHVASLSWPRPIVGDWRGSAGLEAMVQAPAVGRLYDSALRDEGEGGFVPLSCMVVPPGEGRDLGMGCTALEGPLRPRVVGISGPGSGRWPVAVGAGRTKVLVWSPGRARCTLRVRLGGVRPGDPRRLVANLMKGDFTPWTVKRFATGPPDYEARVGGFAEHQWPVILEPGLGTVVLTLRPMPGAPPLGGDDGLWIEALRVEVREDQPTRPNGA